MLNIMLAQSTKAYGGGGGGGIIKKRRKRSHKLTNELPFCPIFNPAFKFASQILQI